MANHHFSFLGSLTMKLHQQTALITGAGSGIGRAIALLFAAEGARIVVAELNEEAASETARLLDPSGADVLVVPTDVGNAESVARLFAAVDERGWPVDILVNCAGTAEDGLKPTDELPDGEWDAMLRVHLSGTFYLVREALRRMQPRQRGVIITFASVAGMAGMPGAAGYTAAKGGVIALTKAVSQEVGHLGIRVNCIAPGWIRTPMLEKLPDEWRSRLERTTLLGRVGEPEEVAAVALYLASDDAGFVTGQVISPNGGLYR